MTALLPCLIAGCGYVGRRLARTEAARRTVRAIVRVAPSAADLQAEGIEALLLDLDRASPGLQPPLTAAAREAAVVYLVPPPERGTTDPRLEAFLAQLGDTNPTVFVYVSTTGVYGDAGGATVDEHTPVAPTSDRARRRVAAEVTVSSWCAARGVRFVVLRVPGIYGPERLPLERLARGEPALRPEDAGPGNRIHVDDLVTTITAAIDRVNAHGVYNVGDGDHASSTVYLQETAKAAGVPAPALVSRSDAPAQISPGMLAFLLESRRVDTRRMREELGVQPRYPTVRSGIEASLAEMRLARRPTSSTPEIAP